MHKSLLTDWQSTTNKLAYKGGGCLLSLQWFYSPIPAIFLLTLVVQTNFLRSVHKKKFWGIVLCLCWELDANYIIYNIKQNCQSQEGTEHTRSVLWSRFLWISYMEDTKEEEKAMTLLMWPCIVHVGFWVAVYPALLVVSLPGSDLKNGATKHCIINP